MSGFIEMMSRRSSNFVAWFCLFLWINIVTACQSNVPSTYKATLQASPIVSATITPTFPNTATPQPGRTDKPVSSPTVMSPELLEALKQTPDQVYLRLETKKEPYHQVLGRLPAACLDPLEGCPPVEIIIDQELAKQVSLEESTLLVVPDGKSIWFLNESGKKLYTFDLSTQVIRTIATDLPILPIYSSWSPDSEWLAVAVQGVTQYDGNLLLINRNSGEQFTLMASKKQVHYPVAWLNNDELIVKIQSYEKSTGVAQTQSPSTKNNLTLVNVHTGQANVLVWDVSSERDEYLSPDGKQLTFGREQSNGNNKVYVLDINSLQETEIKKSIFTAGWSRDGLWILIFRKSEPFPLEDSDYAYYVLHPDGTEEHRVIGYMGPPMCFDANWFPDGRHLLHKIAVDCGSTPDDTVFMLVDAHKDYYDFERESTISLKGKMMENYVLVAISW